MKYTKYIIMIMIMCLLALTFVPDMIRVAEATPIRDVIDYFGAFTGPYDGAAQDDNVKASLDLAHTDLDAVIVGVNSNLATDGTTIAGQTYASVVQATATTDDLFDVDGGAILITSFVGVVTTNIQNQANTCEIVLDADTGWTNYDFSTAVDLDNDQAGQRIVFSNANESVLTPLAGADAGATILMSGWYCGEGMIEQACSAASTGAIKWYMTWIPYEDGTTVTAQ